MKEYYIYDPLHQIQPHFIGFRLVDGVYQEIAFVNERLPSEVLNLELGERDGTLRMYDPVIERWLVPSQERAEQAEVELAEALAALERLQAEKDT